MAAIASGTRRSDTLQPAPETYWVAMKTSPPRPRLSKK